MSLAAGTTLLSRPRTGLPPSIRPTPESLRELFAWKREILAQLEAVPYVEGEVPVVSAWFPTARAVLVWNRNERRQEFVLRLGISRRLATVEGLGVALFEDVAALGAKLRVDLKQADGTIRSIYRTIGASSNYSGSSLV